MVAVRGTSFRARRSGIVMDLFKSKNSVLVMINTLEGLVELLFYILDYGFDELEEYIYFNYPNKTLSKVILVNPVISEELLQN